MSWRTVVISSRCKLDLKMGYPLERLIDYMELVREFERDKLFVYVNLRSFFSHEEIERFLRTALDHGYRILLIDAQSHEKLQLENRVTVDNDLCEF